MIKDKRFENIREGVYQELLKANHHFKIFWSIRTAPDDIAKATRVHLTFFFFTMWANSDRFYLALNNVLKRNKNTYNFYKLFNYIRSYPELSALISEEEIVEMEETINSHEDLIERLINKRLYRRDEEIAEYIEKARLLVETVGN